MAGRWQVRSQHLATRTLKESVMILCTGGEGWLSLEGRRMKVGAGDIFLCPPGVEHGYGCDPELGWGIWWTHFDGPQTVELCRLAGFTLSQPMLHIGKAPGVESSFDALLRTLGREGGDVPMEASLALRRLFFELIKISGGSRDKSLRQPFLDASGQHSLDGMAQNAGYSKYHFCRKFKKETGFSPCRYAMERRLEHARELLLGTRLSIKEISARLGFKNPDYFAKVFARSAGVSPRLYRGMT